MRRLHIPGTGILALAASLAWAAPLSSQQVEPTRDPGADPADGIESVLEHRAADADANRSTVLEFLDRSDVQEVASERGIDLRRVRDAVETLQPNDVRDLSSDIQSLGDNVAGGDRIVIASSTIIIILLVLILIAVS